MNGLTDREVSVIRLVAQAKSTKEIAYELGLKPGTVKVYVSRIYLKLRITAGNNKVALALWAKDWCPK